MLTHKALRYPCPWIFLQQFARQVGSIFWTCIRRLIPWRICKASLAVVSKKAREALTADQQRKEDHACTPYIDRLGSIRCAPCKLPRDHQIRSVLKEALTYLRSSIRSATTRFDQLLLSPLIAKQFCKSEICQFEIAFKVKEHIFGLDVSMCDARLVTVFLYATISYVRQVIVA